MTFRIGILSIVLLLTSAAVGQREGPKNLSGKFNGKDRRFHFGFTLGYNRSSFLVNYKNDFTFSDSLIGVDIQPTPGFNLGIISNLHMTESLKLRFIPSISFQDRNMVYRFLDTAGTVDKLEHRVGSTFLDFPLMIKWRTKRINNFAAYVIGGGQYSIDMATSEEVAPNVPVVRIKKQDISGTIGLGTDFFMPYFKFGIELRYNFGFNDVFLPATNILSSPVDQIYTRGWLLSFTFEG